MLQIDLKQLLGRKLADHLIKVIHTELWRTNKLPFQENLHSDILQTLMNFQFVKHEGRMLKENPAVPVTTAFICASKGKMYDLAAHSSCARPPEI